MKKPNIKKLLAATLAVSMVMASALTVCADSAAAADPSEYSSPGTPVGCGSSDSSDESSTPQTYEELHSQTSGAAISVGGTSIKTSVAGVYAANSVQGVAITTSLADVKAALGLTSGQTPVAIIYDTDVKKSVNAMISVNAAVEALGGTYVTSLNIDLGAKQNGKWVTLSDGNVALVSGLPKNADTTKTYSIVCVQPGGATTIYEDQDTDPKTVTFPVQAGLGTYALVAN